MKSVIMYGSNNNNLAYSKLIDMKVIGHFKDIEASMTMAKGIDIHNNPDSHMIVIDTSNIYQRIKDIDVGKLISEVDRIYKNHIVNYKHQYDTIIKELSEVDICINNDDKTLVQQLMCNLSFVKIIQMNNHFKYIILVEQEDL